MFSRLAFLPIIKSVALMLETSKSNQQCIPEMGEYVKGHVDQIQTTYTLYDTLFKLRKIMNIH